MQPKYRVVVERGIMYIFREHEYEQLKRYNKKVPIEGAIAIMNPRMFALLRQNDENTNLVI